MKQVALNVSDNIKVVNVDFTSVLRLIRLMNHASIKFWEHRLRFQWLSVGFVNHLAPLVQWWTSVALQENRHYSSTSICSVLPCITPLIRCKPMHFRKFLQVVSPLMTFLIKCWPMHCYKFVQGEHAASNFDIIINHVKDFGVYN